MYVLCAIIYKKGEAKISMSIATDIEIMERLQTKALSCGVWLTYTQKVFFLRLVSYAADKGQPCSEGLRVSLSVNEMPSFLNISKRMVIQSLRVLSDCGILLRYNGMTFPRSVFTIVKKKFYERSKNMTQVDLFDDDERQYLNSIVKGSDRNHLTKKSVLMNIAFAREAMDSTETMLLDLIDGLYSKINTLSDEEWGELRTLLPFPVNISFEDNVDEVPADEDEVD